MVSRAAPVLLLVAGAVVAELPPRYAGQRVTMVQERARQPTRGQRIPPQWTQLVAAWFTWFPKTLRPKTFLQRVQLC